MALQPINEHFSPIETRFPVDPAILAAVANLDLLRKAEALALTEPYGDQTAGFEAGQVAAYTATSKDSPTLVKVADGAASPPDRARGIFADSLINTLRTLGRTRVSGSDTVVVSIYHSVGSFKTDVFDSDAATTQALPSTELRANASGKLSANPALAGNVIALVDIGPDVDTSDGQLHFTLI